MASSLSTGPGSRSGSLVQPPPSPRGLGQQFGTVGISRRPRLHEVHREISSYEASTSQSSRPINGWTLFNTGYAGVSEGLWSTSVTDARDELEVLPSNVERMLRKQVSALQVQLSVTRTELDDALKTSRRAAAENEKLRARINQVEAASQDRQQALERVQADLAFCGNIEKRQLWSSLSESKCRIITLQDKLTTAESRASATQKQLTQQCAQFQALQAQHEIVAFLLVYVLFRMHSH
ncbi:hypothetical protein COCOBI_06-1520 [Coccomyxa sp. Obi]|nr:hypothetical protein COCOBI_06-1520 [Coccomyxa sp. Obi]